MNNLKVLFLLSLLLIAAAKLEAQKLTNSGIYITENDFRSHQLTYTLTAKDKLELNEFFEGNSVCFTCDKKSYRIAKDSVYGYRLNNRDYRFFKHKSYAVIDTAGFCLYVKPETVHRNRAYVSEQAYYFSTNAEKKILPLTIANLNRAFAHNAGFRYGLQTYFSNDEQLTTYDSFQHMYKLKYVYMTHQAIAAK